MGNRNFEIIVAARFTDFSLKGSPVVNFKPKIASRQFYDRVHNSTKRYFITRMMSKSQRTGDGMVKDDDRIYRGRDMPGFEEKSPLILS